MKKNLTYTFDDDLAKRLTNPAFKKAWEESEPEYMLAKQLMEKRSQSKISQRDLAKRLRTSQAVISRIETMQANPSLSLLKRIANVLNVRLTLNFQ